MTEQQAATTEKKEVPKDNMLMHVPGVQGGYKGAGYEGWVQIDSFQFGVGCAVGRGGRRRGRRQPPTDGEKPVEEKPEPKLNISQPSVSEIVVTMKEDISAPFLLHTSLNRGMFPELTIVLLSPFERLENRWKIYEVAISGFSESCGRRDAPYISLSLNFNSIDYYSASELRRPINLPDWKNKAEENSPPATLSHDHVHTITVLPDEILQVIFNYFESKELFIAAQACKRFARISSTKNFERIINHTVGYTISKETTTLDGVNIPSTYVAPEGDDDNDYW